MTSASAADFVDAEHGADDEEVVLEGSEMASHVVKGSAFTMLWQISIICRREARASHRLSARCLLLTEHRRPDAVTKVFVAEVLVAHKTRSDWLLAGS